MGWVDLARAIGAVTLFGRGFRELIEPKDQTACSLWSRLPTGRYYLAACVSDIKEIIDRDGDSSTNPIRICENMLWHMKEASFLPCPCAAGDAAATSEPRSHDDHDPVQVLVPFGFTPKLKREGQTKLEDGGAVIFGHNNKLRLHWRITGNPVEGDTLPEVDVDTTELAQDSRLESSFRTPSPSSALGRVGSPASDTPSPNRGTPPLMAPATGAPLAEGDLPRRSSQQGTQAVRHRNPPLRGQLFAHAILGFAFSEATVLFALMMAFLLLYVA